MGTNISGKKSKELEYLRDWCLTILDFLISKSGESPIFSQTKEVVTDTFKGKNLRGLRYCKKDINEWAKGLSPSNVSELNSLLDEKFSVNLEKEDDKSAKIIKQILQRGVINNEDEYRLLLTKVDAFCADDSKKDEVEALNKLLTDYHK